MLELERVREAGNLCASGPPNDRQQRWVLFYDDADMPAAVFDNEQEAVDFWLRAKDAWTCTLLTTVRVPSLMAKDRADGNV